MSDPAPTTDVAPPAGRPFLADLGAAAATAFLWSATFAPLGLPWLAWIALVPWLLRSLRVAPGEPPRTPILAWVVAQFGLHVSVLWWTTTCAPPLAALVPVLGLPFSYLTARLLRAGRARGLPDVVAVPGALVLTEVLRDQALQGLTWASLGYATDVWPAALQLASVGRVHLPALVVVVVNVLLAEAWARRRVDPAGGRRRLAGVALTLVAVQVVGAALRPTDFAAGPRAAGLQPNIPQYRKSGGAVEHLRIHYELLRSIDAADLDLLVFAETSFPSLRTSEGSLGDLLARGAFFDERRRERVTWGDVVLPRPDQTTLLGLPYRRPAAENPSLPDRDGDGWSEWNVAWVVRGRRPTDEIYRKRELAPFGEYLPVDRDFPGYAFVAERARKALGEVPDLIPGTGPLLFRTASPGGPRLGGTTICFEAVFPKYFREAVRGGADFVVNLSNDAWFLDSAELDLVDQATRWRAVECGRAVLRVSNSGISTLFAPDGARRAVVEGPGGRRKEVAGVLRADVPIGRGRTVYAAWGDLPWALPAAAFLGALLLRRRGGARATPGAEKPFG